MWFITNIEKILINVSWLLEVVMQHKKPNFQYDKLYGNAKFFFFHFNSHIRWSSSFVSRFKWTKLKSWFILWQKYANKKSTMQICSNKLKSPNYICTHYCQCYFQIYVISIKKKGFILQLWCFWSHKSSIWMLWNCKKW